MVPTHSFSGSRWRRKMSEIKNKRLNMSAEFEAHVIEFERSVIKEALDALIEREFKDVPMTGPSHTLDLTEVIVAFYRYRTADLEDYIRERDKAAPALKNQNPPEG